MAYRGSEAGSGVVPPELAPFVAKMYEMVSNPRTDPLIRWGKDNNSFLLLDPALFSQSLLPFYFKHSNLSSFIRQLNTYGFRKVDPDRWEFAHESFLRGQSHLLPLIVRRRKRVSRKLNTEGGEGNEEIKEETMMKELSRLKEEQMALEVEIEGVSKRLQATERKPSQMISLLVKVADDPDLLHRVLRSPEEQQGSTDRLAGEKRRRLRPPSPSAPSLVPFQEETLASLWRSDLEGGGDCDVTDLQEDSECQIFSLPATSSPEPAASGTIAYPFCLLGRGFFR